MFLLCSATEPATSNAIFDSVRDVMGSYPFNFTQPKLQARILQGGEEGTFGWVSTNYLSNTFNEVRFRSLKGFSAPTIFLFQR